jgi:hypothetical protein
MTYTITIYVFEVLGIQVWPWEGCLAMSKTMGDPQLRGFSSKKRLLWVACWISTVFVDFLDLSWTLEIRGEKWTEPWRWHAMYLEGISTNNQQVWYETQGVNTHPLAAPGPMALSGTEKGPILKWWGLTTAKNMLDKYKKIHGFAIRSHLSNGNRQHLPSGYFT